MNRITQLSISFVLLLFLAACKKESSNNIDQSRIYSNYQVSYDLSSNKTTVSSTFRVDHSTGQKIELIYPSTVSFNGERLSWRKIDGSYSSSISGNSLNESFKFVDFENKVFVNSLPNIRSIDIPIGMYSISRNGNFFLPWNGDPLAAGETITVTISGGDQSSSATFTSNTVGATYIVLDAYKMQKLVAGRANIQISRERQESLQQSNITGGRISGEFKSRKVSIDVVN